MFPRLYASIGNNSNSIKHFFICVLIYHYVLYIHEALLDVILSEGEYVIKNRKIGMNFQ